MEDAAAQQSRALAVLEARAVAWRAEAAISRWQEATWYDRAVLFHRNRQGQEAVSALYEWAQHRRQLKADEAVGVAVQQRRAQVLMEEAWGLWVQGYHRAVEEREEETAVDGEYRSRLARAVLLFWFNASVIHRHFRLRTLRNAFTLWSTRLAAVVQRRQLQRHTLLAWRADVQQSLSLQRGLVSRKRQGQLRGGGAGAAGGRPASQGGEGGGRPRGPVGGAAAAAAGVGAVAAGTAHRAAVQGPARPRRPIPLLRPLHCRPPHMEAQHRRRATAHCHRRHPARYPAGAAEAGSAAGVVRGVGRP